MSSTTKTTHYNLSQFADADKPTWRGDYNGDMLKIDRGMQCNANAAADAHTAATNAQQTANTAVSKADTNTTAIAQVKTTADNALSLAQTNEENIAANDSELQQVKTQTANQLATMTQQINLKANADDVPTKAYADAHYANHLVGQAAAYKTGTERDFTMTSPTDYKEVVFDAPSVLSPAWATLSEGNEADVALTPGVYQINFELRLINIAAGGEAYKTSIRCELADMAGGSADVLGYVDTYFVKESNNDAALSGVVQGAALSIVETSSKLLHIRLRLHAAHMSAAHPITGRVTHAAISFVKLADADTTLYGMRQGDTDAGTWSSGN